MTSNPAISPLWLPLLEPLYRPIAFEQPARTMAPGSWLGHAPFAFWLIEALRPAVLVELGTATGNSYCAFCQAMERLQIPGSAYAVDTWSGDPHSGAYGEEIYLELLEYSERCYGAFSVLI